MVRIHHVLVHERGWAVTPEPSAGPSAVFRTQSAAWEKAKSIARRERSEAVLHAKDGHVRERIAYASEFSKLPK